MDPSDKTATEKSTKLGVPGKPAGDVEAIVQQKQADRAAVRRRAKLIEEATGGPEGRDQAPRDELSEDAVEKTVDDLIE